MRGLCHTLLLPLFSACYRVLLPPITHGKPNLDAIVGYDLSESGSLFLGGG